jgi:hypothetical protein
MVDALLGSIVTVAGALAGVGLGAWLTSRSQRGEWLRQAHREDLHELRNAYVELLSAYRQFRRYLLAEAPSVALVPVDGDSSRPTPVIAGAFDRWQALEVAEVKLLMLGPSEAARAAAADTRTALYALARARAGLDPGAVQREPIERMRDCERALAEAAGRHLGQLHRRLLP